MWVPNHPSVLGCRAVAARLPQGVRTRRAGAAQRAGLAGVDVAGKVECQAWRAGAAQRAGLAGVDVAGAPGEVLGAEMTSRSIPETALSRFVTGRARAHMTEHNRDGVTVKVLSHTMGETGTGANKFRYHKKALFAFWHDALSKMMILGIYSYHKKSLFAFWHDEHDSLSEMMLLGMYVHEFDANCSLGPQRPSRGAAPGPKMAGRAAPGPKMAGKAAPGPKMAGRVLIECVDSIPLMGGESADVRQKVLTAVILGYIDFVRQAGYRYSRPPHSLPAFHPAS
ncbi:hypothetical protein T484DRAFT_1853672 [Baffinella frigidus]|nr:hypothetical protein T484DRAFT_1853672 [Cryptophyta sp. CCMP2293]